MRRVGRAFPRLSVGAKDRTLYGRLDSPPYTINSHYDLAVEALIFDSLRRLKASPMISQ